MIRSFKKLASRRVSSAKFSWKFSHPASNRDFVITFESLFVLSKEMFLVLKISFKWRWEMLWRLETYVVFIRIGSSSKVGRELRLRFSSKSDDFTRKIWELIFLSRATMLMLYSHHHIGGHSVILDATRFLSCAFNAFVIKTYFLIVYHRNLFLTKDFYLPSGILWHHNDGMTSNVMVRTEHQHTCTRFEDVSSDF